MRTAHKKVKPYLFEVTVQDAAKALDKFRDEAIAEIGANATFKGFRKGMVPKAIVLKEYGEAAVTQRAVDLYLDRNYRKILEKTGIVPVSAGSVTSVKSTDPLKLTIEIETLPDIEIDEKKMAKVSVKKTAVEATAEDAEKAFAEIEKRFTHYHDAGTHGDDGFDASKAVIETGDRVTVDTVGFEKQGGKEIPETKVKAFPLVIGSGQFIPGFEEKLAGHKVGDVVEFDITFPKDYHADAFKGRKVFFMTTVFKLEKAHKPDWSEDFIERLRGVKTDVPGLKDILRKEIFAEREREARQKDESELLTKLLEISTLDLGPGLVAHEVDLIWNEQSANLESQGLPMSGYLSHLKTDEESYKKDVLEGEARRRLSAELILKKIREMKKIEATDEEIGIEVNSIIASYESPKVKERLKAKLVPGDAYYEDIKNRLAYRKVVDLFLK